MEFVYTLKGLDCPHCAEKIERDAAALEQIAEANVNLMQQTLTVKTAHTAEEIFSLIEHVVHLHEPDVEVIARAQKHAHEHTHEHTHEHAHKHEHGECCCHDHAHEHEHEHEHAHGECCGHDHAHGADNTMMIRILAGAVLFVIGLAAEHILHAPETAVFLLMLAAYAVLGWDVVRNALRNILRGRIFDEHFLMSISTVGAFVLGEYPEAAAVMLFYQVGEYFQSLAVQRSRHSIQSLLDIRPDTANVIRNGQTAAAPAESVAVGELIVVKAGERVPLDGTVTDGDSMLDTAALTGESVPRHVHAGDDVRSGCINQSGTLTVRVTKPFGESTASKIIDLVENAAARKAPSEKFITKFARYYTPAVVGAAALLALIPPLLLHEAWADWVRRAFVFLIVSCPCALVISIPLTFFGGIGAASRQGVLVKGSNDLEALSQVRHIVFDKTGTLTKGEFCVSKILPEAGCTAHELLRLAAGCERNSNHPIARSVLEAYSGDAAELNVRNAEEISGYGMRAEVEGKTVLAGSSRLMEREGIALSLIHI